MRGEHAARHISGHYGHNFPSRRLTPLSAAMTGIANAHIVLYRARRRIGDDFSAYRQR